MTRRDSCQVSHLRLLLQGDSLNHFESGTQPSPKLRKHQPSRNLMNLFKFAADHSVLRLRRTVVDSLFDKLWTRYCAVPFGQRSHTSQFWLFGLPILRSTVWLVSSTVIAHDTTFHFTTPILQLSQHNFHLTTQLTLQLSLHNSFHPPIFTTQLRQTLHLSLHNSDSLS